MFLFPFGPEEKTSLKKEVLLLFRYFFGEISSNSEAIRTAGNYCSSPSAVERRKSLTDGPRLGLLFFFCF